jgi:transposase
MAAPSRSAVQSETYPTDLTDEQWEMIRPYVEVQAKRWVVERSHAWLSGNHQLSREYVHHPRHSERWLSLASLCLIGRRLTKAT